MTNELSLEDFTQDLMDELYIPVFERGGTSLDVRDRLEVFKKYHQRLEALLMSIIEEVRDEKGGRQGVNSAILYFWAQTLETEHWKYFGAPWLNRVARALKEVEALRQHMWGQVT